MGSTEHARRDAIDDAAPVSERTSLLPESGEGHSLQALGLLADSGLPDITRRLPLFGTGRGGRGGLGRWGPGICRARNK